MSRYRLIDEAPNNAVTRCFGVWDSDADDYATYNDQICYGLTLLEAQTMLSLLMTMEYLNRPAKQEQA